MSSTPRRFRRRFPACCTTRRPIRACSRFSTPCARSKHVAALVDGGAASNVPVELAWKRVRDGRLGTRNACYLAFDCFHPQWDPRHLWLVPITQAIQLQMVRNAPYADHLVRFEPTLSPANLAPSAGVHRPRLPVGSQQRRQGHSGDHRAAAADVVGRRPPRRPGRAATPRPKSVAWPMSAVMSAIQLPQNRFERWRSRRLT